MPSALRVVAVRQGGGFGGAEGGRQTQVGGGVAAAEPGHGVAAAAGTAVRARHEQHAGAVITCAAMRSPGFRG